MQNRYGMCIGNANIKFPGLLGLSSETSYLDPIVIVDLLNPMPVLMMVLPARAIFTDGLKFFSSNLSSYFSLHGQHCNIVILRSTIHVIAQFVFYLFD